MEVLPCDIGGESHILSRRVPVGIDACRECGVGGGVEPFAPAVLLYERRSVRSAHMECELPWVGAVGGVAVYAAAGVGGVLEYRCLVEVGEAALVDAHLVVVHIARCYASVGESPVVERRVADIHRECGVACPFAVAPHGEREVEPCPAVLLQQCVPLVYVHIHASGVGVECSAFRPTDGEVDAVGASADVEVHRRDAHGDGHSAVVGEYLRLTGVVLFVSGGVAARRDERRHDGYDDVLEFHFFVFFPGVALLSAPPSPPCGFEAKR